MPALSIQMMATLAGVFAVSCIGVGIVRRYAISREVLDLPNDRSSHQVPRPRGGGLALALAAVAGFFLVGTDIDWRVVLALAAVVPAATAGWIDDHGSLEVMPRIAAHVCSGLLVVPLAISGSGPAVLVVAMATAWIVATISAINVVNFMDGIDGIIGLQALVFGVHLWLLAGRTGGGALGLCLGAAALGFLIWNWAPSSIFLGDVGSASVAVIGVVGGILVLRDSRWPFFAVFLPLFPLFLDASVTLIRRWRRGERITQAHRSHLYQRLANESGWGHARVSLLYMAAAAAATVVVLASDRAVAIGAYVAGIVVLGMLLDRYVGGVSTSRVASGH